MSAPWDLRLGRWEDALADVGEVDAVITDPPYSERTHAGHDHAVRDARFSDGSRAARRELSYSAWSPADVAAFVAAWVPRNRGWFVALSDSTLFPAWEAAYQSHGLTSFQPIPCLIPGMSVRLAGDGPSSWSIFACVARPKALCRWGTLPGGYYGPPGEREHIGGKPLWLMRAIVRDYARAGGLVCDPCAGAGTTLLASVIEGRRAIGTEVARARLEAGYTPSLFPGDRPAEAEQPSLFSEEAT